MRVVQSNSLLVLGLVLGFSATGRGQQPPSAEKSPPHTNALIHSHSPYLLQHAHNPVHWLPWGPEAFAKAKAENKPIFVSIGYSTCYWCHVMERESFEDEQVAAVLNAHYVAIKVDREQRPDIDEQLMLATQLMTGRGGWPNSLWLTSDGRPWMAGTYFPREQFIAALEKLASVWQNEAEAVEKQAQTLAQAVRNTAQLSPPTTAGPPDRQPLQRAIAELSQLYDAQHGGFGGKPKFPPHGGLRLLAYAARNGSPLSDEASSGAASSQQMLTRTLNAMWRGGVHDHIGGGFHRYSTDERWFLPHFEKMLYDNAQLLRAYAEGFQLTADPLYRTAALDIYSWVGREMTDSGGAFFSALDSESEGQEGRFNTWSMAELKQVLTAEQAELFGRLYNFTEQGNFTEEASGHRPGTNIPYLTDVPQAVGASPSAPFDATTAAQLQTIRAKLLDVRQQRTHPHLDDKVLTSWNGLMISSLAYAGRTLPEPAMTEAASRAADFILAELQSSEGLLHSWRRGQASIPGYLDDYAFLADGVLELYLSTGEKRWLDTAKSLGDRMRERFEDDKDGGFYFTSEAHEALLVRSKNILGGGNLPVGNGVAIGVLVELYRQTGEEKYLQSAARGLNAFSAVMLKSPRQVEHLVLAGAQYLDVVDQDARETRGRELAGPDAPAASPKSSVTTKPSGDARHQDQALTASLYLSHAQRAPGQQLQIAVGIDIEPNYHLYGSSSGNEVLATSIKLVPQAGLNPGQLQSPRGKTGYDPLLEADVTTLSGTIWFYLPVDITDGDEGPRQLQVQLVYQACDRTRCLQPQEIVLTAPLQISQQQDGRAQYPEVFQKR
ncbi:MAG: DUF255 domain-containing protein [Planctomycetales bacterium]|nr:DUF255 domain-containing protein [Planctomycetales bacterium]